MPFLGGLFSRKNKSSPRPKRDDHVATSSIHASEFDSALSSPTTSYVTPDKSVPTYPNARNLLHSDSTRELLSSNVYPSMAAMGTPTGRKLRLPFARKKDAQPRSELSIGSSPNVNIPTKFDTSRSATNSRPSTTALVSKVDAEDLRRLRPPPSRSAIFAAYSDSTSDPSTHSLPDEALVVSEQSFSSPSPSPQSSKKTSLFSWSKVTPKSSPSSPLGDPTLYTKSPLDPLPPTSPDPANSFNLKSFRHVRAPSPACSNASNGSFAAPVARPRPRGESINSESSQRISVAAFREAQARRSLAGSPSPSLRAPSPIPALSSPFTSTSLPQAVQRQNKIRPRGRQSSMILYTSDSDSSTPSDIETEDETVKRRPGLYEKKGKGKAKSEMGHNSVVEDRLAPDSAARQSASRSHSGHSQQSSGQTNPGTSRNGLDFPSRSQSSLSHHTPAPKLQATVSLMESSSSATVKLVGTQVAPTPNLNISAAKPSQEASVSDSRTTAQIVNNVSQKYKPASSDSGDDSEDDAPLAALVGPRRPGSGLSSYSSLHARSTGNVTTRSTRSSTLGLAKPLIDINQLTSPKRSFAATEKSTTGFTQGFTLLSGTRRSMSPTSLSTENPSDLNRPLTRKVPPVNFISPPPSPPKEEKHLVPHIVDGTGNTAKSDPIMLPLEKSASPGQPRDALTERLSRAVNLNSNPSSSNVVGPNISRATDSAPNQIESPNMRAGDTSDCSRQQNSKIDFPSTKETRGQLSAESPSPASAPKVGLSPPDEDLAQLLGTAGIKFMLRDEFPDQSSENESEEEENSFEEIKREEVTSTGNTIAPIPIKQRPPTSSFSVTSRPPFPGRGSVTGAQIDPTRLSTASNVVAPRPRSITLTPSSTSSTSLNKSSVNTDINPSIPSNAPSKSTSNIAPPKLKNDALKPPNVRQRSSTMLTGVPLKVQKAHVPERPFAVRRDSPASSTGDSSSSRAPLTPRDGSDIGVQDRRRHEWSGGANGLGMKHQHIKRRSVSFEEDHLDSKSLGVTHSKSKAHTNSNAAINDEDRELRRKERRRSEAKAAIELGNVVNGPAPIVDDDDEMSVNHNISPRMSTLNSMMGLGLPMPMQMGFGSPNSVAWGGNMIQPSPYLMPPPPDPNFLAAHQHAMMYAKQAYQMAVARQAMVAAGDEWERGSSAGGYGGSGMIASSPAMMSPHFGMMPLGQGYGWSNPSSLYLPSSSRSMYDGPVNGGGGLTGNSRSELGGVRRPNNWPSSRSSYGESFGPSLDQYRQRNAQNMGASGHAQHDSVLSSRVPVMPAARSQNGRASPVRSGNSQRDSAYLPSEPASQFQSGRGSPDGTPRPRTGSHPASPSRSTYGRKAPPPSSWKAAV